ncbi:MAG TPA: DUF5681 domain-containing protein [Xanthobacteraceae bacterium]|nr:DUF5681 domain-containing protein [Xanthobacteraceae bacterium]
MLDPDRTPNGRFRPGQSGNPAGRPRGSRNKTTAAAEALLDGQAEALTERLLGEAGRGNVAALRMCFDRLAPRRRGRPVPFDLPRLESQADAVDAAAAIVAGVGDGELTPQEGADLIKLVEVFARVRAIQDLERRLAEVERALAGAPVTTDESTGEALGEADGAQASREDRCRTLAQAPLRAA